MGDEVDVSRNPTVAAEGSQLENPDQESKRLKNRSDEQDIRERQKYAARAYEITQAWVSFLIAITLFQMLFKPFKMNLSEGEFIAVFTTTTASIFGFWLLVGRYLFSQKSQPGPVKSAP